MNESVVAYIFCAVGVFISIVLPVLRKALPKAEAETAGISALFPRIWKYVKPYFISGLFSLIVSLLLVAFLAEQLSDWRAALLAGYTFDSTVQKIKG